MRYQERAPPMGAVTCAHRKPQAALPAGDGVRAEAGRDRQTETGLSQQVQTQEVQMLSPFSLRKRKRSSASQRSVGVSIAGAVPTRVPPKNCLLFSS